jgi:hypothetical protein
VKTILLLSAVLLAPALSVTAAEPAAFIELPYLHVIGGHGEGKWLNTQKAGTAIKPGTEFRCFTLKGENGKVIVKKAGPMEDVCTDVWVAETEPELDTRGIAVAAAWNPMPRAVKSSATTQEVYIKAVSAILAGLPQTIAALRAWGVCRPPPERATTPSSRCAVLSMARW